jgi:hypothetical protein
VVFCNEGEVRLGGDGYGALYSKRAYFDLTVADLDDYFEHLQHERVALKLTVFLCSPSAQLNYHAVSCS